jgi:hypothetical protein
MGASQVAENVTPQVVMVTGRPVCAQASAYDTPGAQLGSGCHDDEPATRSRHTFGQRIHTSTCTEQLASTVPSPSHSTSADKHPRKPTGGRENGAEASLGRKVARGGGSEGRRGGREHGADGSMGRTGAWGGWEHGAQGTPRPPL